MLQYYYIAIMSSSFKYPVPAVPHFYLLSLLRRHQFRCLIMYVAFYLLSISCLIMYVAFVFVARLS